MPIPALTLIQLDKLEHAQIGRCTEHAGQARPIAGQYRMLQSVMRYLSATKRCRMTTLPGQPEI